MAELLVELLSEEIPARMQARAAADLERLVTEGLKKAGLEHGAAAAYATPRRLALAVDGLPEKQPDLREERKGPRVGSPDKAIEGFLRSVGLDSLEQCEKREVKGNEFWFAVIERKGQSTVEILPDKIFGAIFDLPWPKAMRWSLGGKRWIRPLHSVLALFDGKVLDLANYNDGLDAMMFPQNVQFNATTTCGHRFLAPEPFAVTGFADYRNKLAAAKVILDPAERRRRIHAEAVALAKKEGLTLREDPGLLDEVAGLVEWPVLYMGRIDEAFMAVPPEVLITSMRTHQRYFSCLNPDGSLAPRFIVAANMETEDGGKAVVAGNERVLRARLSDARFFWDQDRAKSLESRIPALNGITFHARLGSVGDKVDRVEALAVALAGHVEGADPDRVRSAARLAKADLVTEMVGEFPEVQGVMGRYYALHDGEHAEVADAVRDHYAPQGPNGACPTAPVSVCVALADKIDTLVGFWAIDEKPTGSRDPYALRRAALGVIRLVLENGLRLRLADILKEAAFEVGNPDYGSPVTADIGNLLSFFIDRLKVHLREEGVRHDHIAAVFELGGEDDLARLMARVEALSAFLATEDGANLLTAYRRAANILRIEEKKDGTSYAAEPDPALLTDLHERALAEALDATAEDAGAALGREAFGAAMAALARLRAPVDTFFDEVTVNAEDAALRANRLKLLARIRATMDKVADFSKIEG